MKFQILAIFVFAVLSAVTTSDAGGEEVGLMKFLEKERKEIREEQKMMREMLQRETARLEKEDRNLHKRNDKLQRQNDEQKQRIDKQNEDNAKQNKEIVKQSEENRKLSEEMAKQSEEMAKLRDQNQKLHEKLRQADTKIDTKIDSNDTAMRQKDQNINTELKKLIKSEITNFLINERICVGARINFWGGSPPSNTDVDHVVNFGYTFPRNPVVSTALTEVGVNNQAKSAADLRVKSISTSSAVLQTYRYENTYFYGTWLACL